MRQCGDDKGPMIVGTAGHVDHGKTTLIRALTGMECDRLKEEKERGLTIVLGFAHFVSGGREWEVIDVPGHERFIGTMVSGAAAVDVVLLVVACDDSVMPQTEEHVAILDLLDVRAGVVALTKCDLVDRERCEEVREDVENLLRGTCLEGSVTVPVSTTTGWGLGEVTQAITAAAADLERRAGDEPFRMSIDRVFEVHGHGTVVTGSVRSGMVTTGSSVELHPGGERVRVRRLQSHGRDVPSVRAGNRAGVNLAGVARVGVVEGGELAAVGWLVPTRRLLVRIRTLAHDWASLRQNEVVRLHIGGRKVNARVSLQARGVDPSDETDAVLDLQGPIVAQYEDRFVLRRGSPSCTVGGGWVVLPNAEGPRAGILLELAPLFCHADAKVRVKALLTAKGPRRLTRAQLGAQIGIKNQAGDRLFSLMATDTAFREIPPGSHIFATTSQVTRLERSILERCPSEASGIGATVTVPLATLLSGEVGTYPTAFGRSVIDEMVVAGRLVRRGATVGLRGEKPFITRDEARACDDMLAALTSGGRKPPVLSAIAKQLKLPASDLKRCVTLATHQRKIVEVTEDLCVVTEEMEEMRREVVRYIGQVGSVTVSEIKEQLHVSRRYAIPYLEYFDRQKVTRRMANMRVLGPCAEVPLHSLSDCRGL